MCVTDGYCESIGLDFEQKENYYKSTYSFPAKLLHKVVAYSSVNLPITNFYEQVPNDHDI